MKFKFRQLMYRLETSCEQIYQKEYFEKEFAVDSEGFPLMKLCVLYSYVQTYKEEKCKTRQKTACLLACNLQNFRNFGHRHLYVWCHGFVSGGLD